METMKLLLVFLAVSGSTFAPQPRATVAEVGAPEQRSGQLRDAPAVEEGGGGRNRTLPGTEGEALKGREGEYKWRREEEEKESKLVAGISLDDEKGAEGRGKWEEDIKNAKRGGSVERQKDHAVINNLTPPLNAPRLWEAADIPVIQIVTGSPNPPSSHRHVVSASERPASPVPRAEGRTGSPALAEPGHGLRQLRERETLHSEDVHSVAQPEIPSKAQTEAPNGPQDGPTAEGLKAEGTGFARESGGSKKVEQVEVRKIKPGSPPLRERELQSTGKRNQASPRQQNRGSKNKYVTESKEKKRTDNRTPNIPNRKQDIRPTHFPYFLDDYCPPECACYGRVVQCSDKGMDKVPYGIPYNARYILLMNNYIDSIQLDLLSEYVSMEFLVLSNNRLTDGAVEGAFEGILALKRLYLDRNLLRSVPADLPASLEELRLDDNQLRVMSEVAWARCPRLLVLSLSNNSLGNGSDPLPDAVFSPLYRLHTLNLDHNQLASIPLALPLSIKELYLKGNLIEQFHEGAFAGISQLTVLDLSTNRLTNKGLPRNSLLNVTSLESLNLASNKLKQVPRHLPRSLKTLNLEGNLIASIKKEALSALENLEHLGLARNKISKVAPGAFKVLPVLHQLDLCHNSLRQVPRELPRALHAVALTHNRIESVPSDAFCWGGESLSRLVRVQLEGNLIDVGKLNTQAFRCLRGFQVVHLY